MGEEANRTFEVEKDGAIVVKEGDTPVRYVKESDLLALKGSRVSKEDAAKDVEAAKAEVTKASQAQVDTALNRALQAEAKVSSLQEQIQKGGGSAAELAKAQADLETAKTSSEALGSKYLELKRNIIVQAYGVPKETVEKKDLAALEVYEEALKAVIGDKKLGNFAINVGGGGQSALQGRRPIDLAVEAYSHSK